MMQYEKGVASRVGNRTNNQDRGCIVQHEESLLIFVADGMGGHQGGEMAAQETMDCFVSNLKKLRTPLKDPTAYLEKSMREAHELIAHIGENEDPPFYPRTTCVACLIQQDQAWWVHLGDSRLYILRDGEVLERTRDHTYIEELFQNDVITEEEMQTHPMRNYVTYCIGGPNEVPPLSFGHESQLQAGDQIMLCTDGLWGALNITDIYRLNGVAFDNAVNRMAEEAERSSYPNSDNVTLVGIKILHTETAQQTSA